METEIREKGIIANKIKEENDTLIKIRLVFLNLVGNYGMKVKETSEAIGISKRTGYEWIRWWNGGGYGEMKRKRGGAGKPPKLNEEKMKELKERLKEKEHWITMEVKEGIREEEIAIGFVDEISPQLTSNIVRV